MPFLRILIIEDNPLNRQLARAILEQRGHQVSEAVDVEGGWLELQQGNPQIILMDIQLPGGGGEYLLRKIRSNPSTARLPVIAITAYAMQGDRERFLDMGFDGYLTKPLDTRAFGPAIEAFSQS
ncbi:MAG TPA: response regulator [Myxococcales bacterium]